VMIRRPRTASQGVGGFAADRPRRVQPQWANARKVAKLGRGGRFAREGGAEVTPGSHRKHKTAAMQC
jgi:hypothetical protein